MHRVDLSWANTTQYLTQAHLPAQITVVTSFLPRRYTHTCSLSTDLQILYPLHQLAETSWSLWKSPSPIALLPETYFLPKPLNLFSTYFGLVFALSLGPVARVTDTYNP